MKKKTKTCRGNVRLKWLEFSNWESFFLFFLLSRLVFDRSAHLLLIVLRFPFNFESRVVVVVPVLAHSNDDNSLIAFWLIALRSMHHYRSFRQTASPSPPALSVSGCFGRKNRNAVTLFASITCHLMCFVFEDICIGDTRCNYRPTVRHMHRRMALLLSSVPS